MRQSKTVFVLGAGASSEVNLPLGSELKKYIATNLDIRFPDGYNQSGGDRLITEALRTHTRQANPSSNDINPLLHACWRIRDAMPQAPSIDNFIDAHAGDNKIAICGKIAIARTILDAEATSSLALTNESGIARLDFARIELTWFNIFFQILFENCRKDDLAVRLQSIALVIFNYDRCFEHFLYYALQNYYAISPEEATSLIWKIEIFHPYGTVGNLPWRSQLDSIAFGARPSAEQLHRLAGSVKTFTEGTDSGSLEIGAIRSLMRSAPRLVFLGFAFHRLNLDLLFLPPDTEPRSTSRQILATATGLSKSDVAEIRNELSLRASIDSDVIHIREDLRCAGLFKEYSRTLSKT